MRNSKEGSHMKPKVVVVGAGYWGKNLIRNFFELGALGAICDNNELLNANYNPGSGLKIEK